MMAPRQNHLVPSTRICVCGAVDFPRVPARGLEGGYVTPKPLELSVFRSLSAGDARPGPNGFAQKRDRRKSARRTKTRASEVEVGEAVTSLPIRRSGQRLRTMIRSTILGGRRLGGVSPASHARSALALAKGLGRPIALAAPKSAQSNYWTREIRPISSKENQKTVFQNETSA